MPTAESAAVRIVVPAPAWVGLAAFALALLVPAWRRQPATTLPAIFSVLPWLPLPLPPIALVWTGPLAWAPIAGALAATLAAPRGPGSDRHAIDFTHSRGHGLAAGGLTFALCIVAAVILAPRLPGGDEPHYLVITQSLLQDGDLDIENNHDGRDYAAYYAGDLRPDLLRRGARGEAYSIHAPGVPVLVAPAFAAAGYRGAQAMIMLIAAICGAMIWWIAWRAIGDRRGAWLTWAAIVLTPTFLVQGVTIFPDGPGALATAAAIWLLMRLGGPGAPPSTVAIAGVSVLLAALPWLHTRFAVLAAVLGVALLSRLLRSQHGQGRVRRIAAFAAVPAFSAAAWFGFFYVSYGSFDPTAPYGSPAGDRSIAFAPGGIGGLLFDQQFGIVAFAPVLLAALAGSVAALRSPWRSVAIAAFVASIGYLAATGTYWMWWGGVPAPPARFLTAILPVAALPVAIAWHRSSGAARLLMMLALIWSAAVTAAVVVVDRGALLWSVRDGQAAWLNWLGPVVNLPRGWPSFFWELTPGVVRTEWPFALHVMLWVGAIASAAAATTAICRRVGQPLVAPIAACGLIVAAMTAIQGGWLLNRTAGLDPARSQLRAVAAIARGDRLDAIGPLFVRRATASSMLIRAEEPPRFRPETPVAVFQRVAPGAYEVTVWLARPRSGELIVRDGAREMRRFPLASLSEQTAVFSLPEGSETLVVDVDAGLREMATIALRPR